jgi:hypothetical protein
MKSRKMKLKPTSAMASFDGRRADLMEVVAIMVLVSRFDEGNGEEINGCLKCIDCVFKELFLMVYSGS